MLFAGSSDIAIVTTQFCDYLTTPKEDGGANIELRSHAGGVPSTAEAIKYVETLADDGSWPDIDYANTARSSWLPFRHVIRMTSMAARLHAGGLSDREKGMVVNACRRAAKFWMKHDFVSPNWWYNEIGVPQFFGEYALLLGNGLPEDEKRFIADTILARSQLARTGQNRVWLAGNVLMRAMLTNNEQEAKTASEAIWNEVRVSGGEGIQPDWSFHQHGPQQQFGNYGMGFAVEIARWSTILRGTAFAVPAQQQEAFRRFLLEGVDWVVWQGALDLAACARQITPDSPVAKAKTFRSVFSIMQQADPLHSGSYAAFVRRNSPGAVNDLVGSRYFWRSDYFIQRQLDLFASLKMSSARVIGTELVNSENLAGRYLADGALLLLRRGDEYANIYPVWDWRHIPGCTLAWSSEPPRTGKEDDRLMTTWVGGVSTGSDGCAVLDYDRDGVRARKGWFFHEDRVVCLGNGIRSELPLPIHTSVNQCLLKSPVSVIHRDGGVHTLPAEASLPAGTVAVAHGGLCYTLIGDAHFGLDAKERTGNWSIVFTNPSTPIKDVRAEVFDLWIDHGSKPHDGAYAWMVSPEKDNKPKPTVIVNSAAAQAIRWSGGCAQAAFWQPGRVEAFPECAIEVEASCLMLLTKVDAGWRCSVSDPSQKLRSLRVTIGQQTRTIELPQGLFAGSTVTTSW